MPRSPRIVLPGFPHHVIHQGHNKQPVFVEEVDYIFYLATLAELKLEFVKGSKGVKSCKGVKS